MTAEEELNQHCDGLAEKVRKCTLELQRTNDELRREVAGHKHTEEALRKSEERYRVLFEGSIHGILAVDVETERFVYANPSICRMFGYSEAEFRQLGIESIHPEESLDHVMTEFGLQMSGKKPLAFKLPCLRKDGAVFFADVTGVRIIINGRECIVRFFADVTERKQAEERLKESEKLFRSMAENIREVFWIATPDYQRIEYVSPAFEEIWGRTTSDLYQNSNLWFDVIHPEDRDKVLCLLDRLAQSEPYRIQYRIFRPDGTIRWVEDRGYPVKDSLGQVFRTVGVARDITERKEAEDKIQALNVDLQRGLKELLEAKVLQERASRAKAEFLANISHELTTPLNSIIGFSQVLLGMNFGDLSEKQQGYVSNILSSGERLHDTLKNIISFVCMDVSNPDMYWEDVRLKDIVASSLSVFKKAAADRHLTLALDMASEADRLIRADRGKLVEAFHSLLSNAVKFTPDGGSIHVHARLVPSKESGVGAEEKIVSEHDAGFIEISVVDTGNGIREEDMPRLFRPFEQLAEPLTKQYSGVGMGLVLARKLIEAHGGAIRMESEYGKGTRVIFTIPVRRKDGE